MEIRKPISVAKYDFESNLTNLINTSNVPFIILEPILKEIYENVKAINKKTLEQERQQYYEELSKIDENGTEE